MPKRDIQKSTLSFIPIFLIFIVFALFLGQIRQYPEYPGEVGLHVNVINSDGHRNHKVQVRAYMVEEGAYAESNYFTILRNSPASQSLFICLPYYTQPGWHIAKVELLHEGKVSDSQYIYVDTV